MKNTRVSIYETGEDIAKESEGCCHFVRQQPSFFRMMFSDLIYEQKLFDRTENPVGQCSIDRFGS